MKNHILFTCNFLCLVFALIASNQVFAQACDADYNDFRASGVRCSLEKPVCNKDKVCVESIAPIGTYLEFTAGGGAKLENGMIRLGVASDSFDKDDPYFIDLAKNEFVVYMPFNKGLGPNVTTFNDSVFWNNSDGAHIERVAQQLNILPSSITSREQSTAQIRREYNLAGSNGANPILSYVSDEQIDVNGKKVIVTWGEVTNSDENSIITLEFNSSDMRSFRTRSGKNIPGISLTEFFYNDPVPFLFTDIPDSTRFSPGYKYDKCTPANVDCLPYVSQGDFSGSMATESQNSTFLRGVYKLDLKADIQELIVNGTSVDPMRAYQRADGKEYDVNLPILDFWGGSDRAVMDNKCLTEQDDKVYSKRTCVRQVQSFYPGRVYCDIYNLIQKKGDWVLFKYKLKGVIKYQDTEYTWKEYELPGFENDEMMYAIGFYLSEDLQRDLPCNCQLDYDPLRGGCGNAGVYCCPKEESVCLGKKQQYNFSSDPFNFCDVAPPCDAHYDLVDNTDNECPLSEPICGGLIGNGSDSCGQCNGDKGSGTTHECYKEEISICKNANTNNAQCVECTDKLHCQSGETCNQNNQCVSDSCDSHYGLNGFNECASNVPICGAVIGNGSDECDKCNGDMNSGATHECFDDDFPKCKGANTSTASCVECLSNTDCNNDPTKPICSSENKCISCIENNYQCPPGLYCLQDGSCGPPPTPEQCKGVFKVEPVDLTWVNNTGYEFATDNVSKTFKEEFNCEYMAHVLTLDDLYIRHNSWQMSYLPSDDSSIAGREQFYGNQQGFANALSAYNLAHNTHDILYCIVKVDPNSVEANTCKNKQHCYAILAKHLNYFNHNEIRKFDNTSIDKQVILTTPPSVSISSPIRNVPNAGDDYGFSYLYKSDREPWNFGPDTGYFTIYPKGTECIDCSKYACPVTVPNCDSENKVCFRCYKDDDCQPGCICEVSTGKCLCGVDITANIKLEPDIITPSDTSKMTLTISNPSSRDVQLAIPFTITIPPDVNVSNVAGSCNATLSGKVITIATGATISNSGCNITADLTSGKLGSYPIVTSALQAEQGQLATVADSVLKVICGTNPQCQAIDTSKPICGKGARLGECDVCNGDMGSGKTHECYDNDYRYCKDPGQSIAKCVECLIDSHCDTGQICLNNQCVDTVCDGDYGSGTPNACKDNKNPICDNPGTVNAQCRPVCDGDYQSGTNYPCQSSQKPLCKGIGTANAECVAPVCDGDYGSGTPNACKDNKNPICDNPGTLNAVCRPVCDGDYQSGTAYPCPTANLNICKDVGKPTAECIACDSDSDCAVNEACYFGQCVNVGSGTCYNNYKNFNRQIPEIEHNCGLDGVSADELNLNFKILCTDNKKAVCILCKKHMLWTQGAGTWKEHNPDKDDGVCEVARCLYNKFKYGDSEELECNTRKIVDDKYTVRDNKKFVICGNGQKDGPEQCDGGSNCDENCQSK